MAASELEYFLAAWDRQAQGNLKLLKSLPADKYDFRPDPGGRSLGELGWHLAEGDAFMSYGIEQGKFDFSAKPPGMERPRTVDGLASGFERIHQDAVARIKKLKPEDLDRRIMFVTGDELPIRDILWNMILAHGTHHTGQLSLMCRLSGGCSPGIYGPNREEMAAMRAAATKA